jgi:transposase
MSELQLTRWQRIRLRRQLRQTRDARVHRRTLAILEYSRGRPLVAIARMLGVTRQSIYNGVAAYTQGHDPTALGDEERSGRPSLWTEDLRTLLRSLLGQAPDQCGSDAVNWTVPLLQEQIEHSSGQWLSEDTLPRELDRLGYVWKRGRYALDPDPEREKKTPDPPVDSMPAAAERRAG